MYFAGSAGTVDPADVVMVTYNGCIVQLGAGPPVTKPAAEPATGIPRPQTTATIRYPVTTEVSGAVLGAVMLALRYRPGDGRVLATLNEVPLLIGVYADPGTVTETTLLEYDSNTYKASQDFLTNSSGGPGTANPTHPLDFASNLYYVTLILTAPETTVGTPPAVAAIGVVPWQQF
jgi:hypothetical protein